ncbi:T9SS type A sorting domain-containing protein, partial [candidate division WOR-3 bacterium]|nr:T9SS type A sorting domain-containing protein [candidate division WOR-3 bacterium]
LDYRTDGGEAKDLVSQILIPPEFSVNKLYERLGNLDVTSFVNSVNADGFSFMNHIGHGSTNALQCGPDYLSPSDINLLTNGTKLGTVYSTSCLSSAFDGDCIGWTFLSNPNGGSVSYIGNSRYGWYTPGFPGSGTSDVMDFKFYETVFSRGEDVLGRAFVFHKALFVGLAREQNDYRWLMFALTLFGDPSARMWTSTQIASPSVQIPQGSFPASGGTMPLSVRDGSGVPLEGAIVCLSSQGRIMSFGATGTSGNLLLQYDTAFASQGVLCVWGRNISHYERVVSFSGAGYRLQVDSVVLLDTGYNNNIDGFFSSGETAHVTVFVKNTGTEHFGQITALVSSSNPGIGAVISADTIPSLNAGSSGSFNFIFGASPAVLDTSGAGIVLSLEASSYADSFPLPIDIENPDMRFLGFRLEDTISGNGDGYLEPGETAVVKFIFENEGSPSLFEGLTVLSVAGSDLTLIDSLFDHQTVAHGDTAVFVFVIRAEATALSGPVYSAHLSFKSGELTLPESGEAQIKVGLFGFCDDMESGQGNWTASGTQNLWHLTQTRSHSPSHSWYCGNDGTHTYPPDFTDTLESPYFATCPDMYLSFWHFYATEAGYDYCLVQQLTVNGWVGIMTFSGFSNGWVREIFSLDASEDSTKIRFVFYSEDNQNQYEGWFIDDVEIYGNQITQVEEEIIASLPQIRYSGSFITQGWKILLSSSGNEFVNISIYDISGRQIQVIYEGVIPRGEHGFSMPSEIPAGVYFLKVNFGTLKEEIKLIKAL